MWLIRKFWKLYLSKNNQVHYNKIKTKYSWLELGQLIHITLTWVWHILNRYFGLFRYLKDDDYLYHLNRKYSKTMDLNFDFNTSTICRKIAWIKHRTSPKNYLNIIPFYAKKRVSICQKKFVSLQVILKVAQIYTVNVVFMVTQRLRKKNPNFYIITSKK